MSSPVEYEYDSYAVSAAEAQVDARAAFIRNTYAHLAGAILAFIGLEALLLSIPGVKEASLMMMESRLTWLVVLLAFMGVSWIADRWAQSDMSKGMQYLGLSLYVAAEAVIFLPLLAIATMFYEDAIQTAGILTLTVFGGLTLAVFLTRGDYSHIRPILSIGSFIALGVIVAGAIFGFTLGLFFCFAMVALASGYIIYYTSNVLHHYRTDQYVAASLALFAAVALLFWYILQIVMRSRD
jgi:FtsH-binding integral membrane protein